MLSIDDGDLGYLDGSDDDSALMEDTLSEPISSSVTTSGSSSLSDDEQVLIQQRNQSEQIEELLQRRSKGKLIKCAKSFGLLDIRYRKQIWPLLINAPTYSSIHFDPTTKTFSLPSDNYYAAGTTRSSSISLRRRSPSRRFRSNRTTSSLWTSAIRCRTNVETISTK